MFKNAHWHLVKGILYTFGAGFYKDYVEELLNNKIKNNVQGELSSKMLGYLASSPRLALQIGAGVQFIEVIDRVTGYDLEE